MRIFYLTSEFLWPPHHGGRVRSLAQLRGRVREGHRAILVIRSGGRPR